MCGIAGLVDLAGAFGAESMKAIVTDMAGAMVHRGPDDAGVWLDPAGTCAFSHRRLSIIDLTPAGHQPMRSLDGEAVIVFNGELYNFRELRSELEARGIRFGTRTDTEVVLEALRHFGADAFGRFDGMFALALFDRRSRQLLLARDPFGEKPLYYAFDGRFLAFASELTALTRCPAVDTRVEIGALAEYLALGYVLPPRTVYRGVRKLPPGCALRLSPDGRVQLDRYFGFEPTGCLEGAGDDELADELEEILERSIRRRLISDVPLGAFLSGGVDSSTVVALMARGPGARPETFSIGFSGSGESEHPFARQVAEHLGTNHHERVLEPDVADLTLRIGRSLDEPIADASCLPTYLLSGFARERVTVALSGDGGDELFGGYDRYLETIRHVTSPARKYSPSQVYFLNLLAFSENELRAILGGMPAATSDLMRSMAAELDDETLPLIMRMRRLDSRTYLPGCVLAKVDRMSMQHSLEVRSPFLSVEVARFAERLDADRCCRAGEGKVILRHLASRYLPEAWLKRPKTGFGLPTLWGMEGLAGLCRDLLLGADSLLASFLDRRGLVGFVERQLDPRTFATAPCWSLLTLEIWLRAQRVSAVDRSSLSGIGNRVGSAAPAPVLVRLWPPSTRAGAAFNVQADGTAALSIECENAKASTAVLMDGRALATTFGSPRWLTALVPGSYYEQPGRHEICLVEDGLESNRLAFDVEPEPEEPSPVNADRVAASG